MLKYAIMNLGGDEFQICLGFDKRANNRSNPIHVISEGIIV